MLSQKLTDALNAQINAEMWSAYLYLAMGMHFEAEGFGGIANWFKVQFKEEQAHAEILMNYVNSRGNRVVLEPIAAVPTKWDSVLAAFEETLKHEKEVTAMIHNLYAMAEAENDYATRIRMDWFVTEQVEEEESAQELVDQIKLVGENGMALLMLNQQLGARKYQAPSPLA